MSFIRYIQRRDKQTGQLETVDEVVIKEHSKANRRALNFLLNEYRLADSSATYYTSSRACKDWRNK